MSKQNKAVYILYNQRQKKFFSIILFSEWMNVTFVIYNRQEAQLDFLSLDPAPQQH